MSLHPQAQAFIDHLASENPPSWEELGPVEARLAFNGLKDVFGVGPELATVEDQHWAGDVRVRLYRPDADRILPVVMFFHGGGWVLGNLDTHDALCRKIAQRSGAAVVSVDYELAPEHAFPGPLHQCYEATQYALEHADPLGLDANALAVAGDSAGGNLAAAVAIRARDEGGPSIQRQVLLYPVIATDFETDSYQKFAEGYGLTRASMKWFWQNYLAGRDDWNVPLADLRHHDLADLPPALVITAEYDVLRDESDAFADRLRSSGVDVQHHCYEGMLHGFVHFATLFDAHDDAIGEISSFIQNC